MKWLFLFVFLGVMGEVVLAQAPGTTVFGSGTGGYASFRIPAIVRAPNKDLLAFAEGRVNGSNDFGNIKVVMRRSMDGGRTWGDMQVVASNDTLQAGNPAPVVDASDPAYPSGRIFLFYCTGNQPEGVVRKGKGVREVWYKTSTDNGVTWSEPVNITLQVHRPNQPSANPAYRHAEDWRCYATTPGHAIQLVKGRFAGRIVVPINHSSGEAMGHFMDFRAGDFFTDDHGKSWHLSDDVAIPGGNEDMAAEMGDGRVLMTIRNQRGDQRCRAFAVSSDGGASWDSAWLDSRVADPICQGSILSLGSSIAVCSNDDTTSRNNLTVRVSYDAGRSWGRKVVVDRALEPSSRKDHTAYSDIVRVGKKRIGVLYERDGYKEIVFRVIKW